MLLLRKRAILVKNGLFGGMTSQRRLEKVHRLNLKIDRLLDYSRAFYKMSGRILSGCITRETRSPEAWIENGWQLIPLCENVRELFFSTCPEKSSEIYDEVFNRRQTTEKIKFAKYEWKRQFEGPLNSVYRLPQNPTSKADMWPVETLREAARPIIPKYLAGAYLVNMWRRMGLVEDTWKDSDPPYHIKKVIRLQKYLHILDAKRFETRP